MHTIKINGKSTEIKVPHDTPLLWVIREVVGLTGTNFGCGKGLCGACTVHINGKATRTCITSVGDAIDADITTIEGLHPDGQHPVQKAWVAEQVPQCGYCQSGQIMQAASFLAENKNPSDADIVEAMTGNLCRCMTYNRIKKAVRRAANEMKG
jgi:isoquinoline 1-oxidoreductase alpha subunit